MIDVVVGSDVSRESEKMFSITLVSGEIPVFPQS